MAWRAITVDDVQAGMSGQEVRQLQNKFLADGQVDPVGPIISAVTDEVRGFVETAGTYTIGSAGTVPDRLVNATVDIVRFQLLLRIPNATQMTEDRRKARDDAYVLLNKVAEGKWSIGEAAVGDDVIANVPMINAPTQLFTRETEDGI